MITPPPARCTLRPRGAVVPVGTGLIQIRPNRQSAWRTYQNAGNYLSGGGPAVLSPWRSGQLRFPSGAVIPFACGDDAVVVVTEPLWIIPDPSGDAAFLVDTEAGGVPTAVVEVIRGDASVETCTEVRPSVWACEATERLMLRVAGRVVPRWLGLNEERPEGR